MSDDVGRNGAPAPPEEAVAVEVCVTVDVTAEAEDDGVMVMTTVTRIVEGVGSREMMLVEVVVRVVRAGLGRGEWTPGVC